MMVTKTCLLISDDPDDPVEFTEALNEISAETVVLTVSAIDKAIDLLKMKKCLPDFLFIDLGLLTDYEPDIFFRALEGDEHLHTIQVIVFGDPHPLPTYPRIAAFLNTDMNYPEFKEALRGAMGLGR